MKSRRVALAVLTLALTSFAASQHTARSDTSYPEKFGVGVVIVQHDSTSAFVVRDVHKNGPADRAGLRAGDEILALDGQPVASWSFKQLIDHLLIARPLPVHITVRRGTDRVTVEVQRMRMSDVIANAGYRLVANADSTNYSLVPLVERTPLKPGDKVVLSGLRDARCRDAEWKAFPGGSTVIYFWASWCGPCKLLMKRMADERIDAASVRIVGLNIDQKCEQFQAFADSLRPPGQQFWTGGSYSDACQAFRVYQRGVPTVAVLDHDGRLVASAVGIDSALVLIRSAR